MKITNVRRNTSDMFEKRREAIMALMRVMNAVKTSALQTLQRSICVSKGTLLLLLLLLLFIIAQ
jgi:preprotein translocase subunit SecF